MISVEDWQPVDGLILEPNALTAAREQVRCQALTAGPGAGKTEMLAQRADFLLRTGVSRYPKRILAISFKVDASRNLKERIRRRCGSSFSSRFDSYTFHAFAKRIIDRFRPVLAGLDELDVDYTIGDKRIARRQIEFSDLVPLATQILESCETVRTAIRQTYGDIFLDEFQDCTAQQYKLITLAFQATTIRLIAVGDTKQRIMGWAGAMEGIFSSFAADFNAVSMNMYLNFRSKPRLLRMQNQIIRELDPSSVMPDEQIIGNEGEIYAWGFEDSQQEAEYLTDRITHWIENEGVPHGEIAILVRQQADLFASAVMAELEKSGIPYRNEQQLQDISVEPAARLIVDYLLSLYGRREPAAWIRLMDQLIPIADEVEQEDMRQSWQQYVKAERKDAALLALFENPWPKAWTLVEKFLGRVGTTSLTALSPDYESASRLEEVIRETRAQIEVQLKIEPDLLKALSKFSDDQSVRILTIHKSKGLEFDSVILLAVEKEMFWGKNLSENLCTFFVGVSRAKRRLVLTCAKQRARPPAWNRRWDVQRTPHRQYFEYAKPFLSKAE